MTEHEIVWEFHQDYVGARAICNATDSAPCHWMPDCDCEGWDQIKDSVGYHHFVDGDEKVERHDHHQVEYCNILEWLNGGDLLECAEGRPHFEIARTPIETPWSGDYYEWKPA